MNASLISKMTEIVSGVLKVSFGFLASKIRKEVAERLQHGDATDEECRQFVVQELDDIKRKLDGLARKDLHASVLFLKEGIEALYQSLHQAYSEKNTAESGEQASFEGAVSSRDADGSPINVAIALVNAIASLKIRSNERLKSAMESFKLAREKATEAFANESLSIEERIKASQVRMMARILECLEDPDAGVGHCLQYLEELHDLGTIQETFSVLIDGGWKSRFNETKRVSIASSVQIMNRVLFDFARKFTKVQPNTFGWPTILLGKKTYRPLLGERRLVRKLKESGVRIEPVLVIPDITFDERIDPGLSAVNSKGSIVAKTRRENVLKVFKRAGECHTLCEVLREGHSWEWRIVAMDIDVEDNLYVITGLEESNNEPWKVKLHIFDENGDKKSESPLPLFQGTGMPFVRMSINKNKRIAILDGREEIVYTGKVCVQQNLFEVDTSFKLKSGARLLIFSDLNGPKIVTGGLDTICIYTVKGELQQENKVPLKEGEFICSLAVNHVTGRILVSNYMGSLFWFSETGELIECSVLIFPPVLCSHPQGPIALVDTKRAFFLQM